MDRKFVSYSDPLDLTYRRSYSSVQRMASIIYSKSYGTEDNDLDLVNEQSDSVYHGTSRHREGLLEPTTGAIVWMQNVFQGLSLFLQVVLLGGGRSPKWSDIVGGFR